MTQSVGEGNTIRDLMWTSFEKHAGIPAIGFTGEKMLTYGELRDEVEHLAFRLTRLGYVKGDRIAILGPNSPNWIITYFACLSVGIVAVPILPDFHEGEIAHILEHSSTGMLAISRKQTGRLDTGALGKLRHVMILEDFSLLDDVSNLGRGGSTTPYVREGSMDPFAVELEGEDLASLIYTSGTTGFSKGVMLTNSNLATNIRQCAALEPLGPGDVMLSMLPLSHTLENTVGMMLPLAFGSTIHYLDKLPTPAVLLPALKSVRPTHMVSVPLVIEKIFKSQIKGKVDSSKALSALYKFPPFRRFFHKLAAKKLYNTFGGRLRFFGIGGAKLDAATEQFLREGGFPYAIGYGLTETAPLLAGTNAARTRFQSTGKPVPGIELVINNPDPETGIGEIWARGPNVMRGYYNEPEITAQVLKPDGWFRTGDLGIFDHEGYLFILGRLKNVILGASGENIYPEEIESVINRFQYVLESVVVEQKGRLVALVHFNREELEKQFAHLKEEARHHVEKKIEELKEELRQFVNSQVNRYSRLQAVVIQETPFEKTPTKKIKRFLYQVSS